MIHLRTHLTECEEKKKPNHKKKANESYDIFI